MRTHVSRILAKLGLRDRTQAVVVAYESGLVRPGSADVADWAPARTTATRRERARRHRREARFAISAGGRQSAERSP